MEHKSDSDTSYNWCIWNDPQKIDKGAGRIRNWRARRYLPNYSIIEIDQNTEKSPGDLRRLTFSQTRVKYH